MVGKAIYTNYLDPSNSVVDLHIKNIVFLNTLIDRLASINVMTRESILKTQPAGSPKENHNNAATCRHIHSST